MKKFVGLVMLLMSFMAFSYATESVHSPPQKAQTEVQYQPFIASMSATVLENYDWQSPGTTCLVETPTTVVYVFYEKMKSACIQDDHPSFKSSPVKNISHKINYSYKSPDIVTLKNFSNRRC